MSKRDRKILDRVVAAMLITLLVVAIAGAVASSARGASMPSVQLLAVVNHTHVPAAAVARLESAVTIQVNRQLDAWWQRPHVEFVQPGTPGAWPVTLVTGRSMVARGYCGYHGPVVGGAAIRALGDVGGPRVLAGGAPYAVVGLSGACDQKQPGSWSIVFSHEVLEMIVDPLPGSYKLDGLWPEVGDPVNGTGYNIEGVRVSNFVTPAYFFKTPHMKQDQLGLIWHK